MTSFAVFFLRLIIVCRVVFDRQKCARRAGSHRTQRPIFISPSLTHPQRSAPWHCKLHKTVNTPAPRINPNRVSTDGCARIYIWLWSRIPKNLVQVRTKSWSPIDAKPPSHRGTTHTFRVPFGYSQPTGWPLKWFGLIYVLQARGRR